MPSFQKTQTPDRQVNQLQNNIAKSVDPLLSNPALFGRLITGLVLGTGVNTVNHGLGRKLQGWFPVRVRSAATFYDNQDANSTPDLTLLLYASAPVTVDLYVF